MKSRLLLLLLLATPLLSSAARLGAMCTADSDCDAGLRCDGCSGQQGVCVRIRPYDPRSKGRDLPFNEYSWLTTHNSFARQGAVSATGTPLLTFTNQQDSITSQLNNGVRGLMLDMYDFENDVWLCHSFGGQCFNFTAFQPAINVLREIQVFLEANPSEVVTIFIEDYVRSTNGLTRVFNASGLMTYWYPVDQMPRNGSWPLLSSMINQNHRLLVFTSIASKEASEGIAYEWNYVVENQYGDEGLNSTTCPNRTESSPMDTTSKSLVLMNYFQENPVGSVACSNNLSPLVSMLGTCHNYSANRWANFVAVDFYLLGDAPEAVNVANGHMVCGCDNFAYCRSNATFGTCDVPPPPPPSSSPRSTTPGSTSDASITGGFSMLSKVATFSWLLLLEFI
ncbi:PI-PLC X domain-containing protein At5g67130-like [Zingiber officinale]|uniref:PI-PLC X domain-containing protein At5g67130-like n=1 Tax=Zingiber officinale TaxID=94328 RepID=UPI001C4C960E|nr:PI-PLC X domain-containing protein At5g67130-like [Zingiber officinale]